MMVVLISLKAFLFLVSYFALVSIIIYFAVFDFQVKTTFFVPLLISIELIAAGHHILGINKSLVSLTI